MPNFNNKNWTEYFKGGGAAQRPYKPQPITNNIISNVTAYGSPNHDPPFASAADYYGINYNNVQVFPSPPISSNKMSLPTCDTPVNPSSSSTLLAKYDRRTDEYLYQRILKRAKREFEEKWNSPLTPGSAKLDDYYLKRTLGQGSFGRVVHVIYKPTGKSYAVKMLKKGSVVRKQQVQQVFMEKRILSSIDFPFLIRLIYAFQDNSNLYMVLQLIPGGEMYYHLKKMGRFSEPLAKFYACQVVLSLEYLHSLELAYRDLKPENILLDHRGYIKIVDFGFTKKVCDRTFTFCGTPDYMAPEVISNKSGYGKEVDWWGLGVLIYEMITGNAPFSPTTSPAFGGGFFMAAAAGSNESTMSNIVKGRYSIPKYLMGTKVADLIKNLLQVNPYLRLGVLEYDARDVVHHPWFDSINWMSVYRKTHMPEHQPCNSPTDLRNFKPINNEKPIEISDFMEYPKHFINF